MGNTFFVFPVLKPAWLPICGYLPLNICKETVCGSESCLVWQYLGKYATLVVRLRCLEKLDELYIVLAQWETTKLTHKQHWRTSVVGTLSHSFLPQAFRWHNTPTHLLQSFPGNTRFCHWSILYIRLILWLASSVSNQLTNTVLLLRLITSDSESIFRTCTQFQGVLCDCHYTFLFAEIVLTKLKKWLTIFYQNHL